MPLPHRFLTGASAAAHVPQLLATASRQHLATGALRNRRLEVGAVGVAQLLEKNWSARFYTVGAGWGKVADEEACVQYDSER